MFKISDEYLLELNNSIDIYDLVSAYVDLSQAGRLYRGLCPFHNEHSPSFYVYPDTNSFYCFGCGKGGSIITFVKMIENLDFYETVKFLSQMAGLSMPIAMYDDSYSKLKNRIYEINRETARFYHNHLISPEGKQVLNYFLSRKLHPKTIKHFGLGAAPDSWDALTKYLRQKGYTNDELLMANVAVESKRGNLIDRFSNRAMFPIIDLAGNVIGFGGRALPGSTSKAKYINTSDTPVFKKSKNLYALNFAKSCCKDKIILAEGYMDVITMHQAGFQNAVAALGTSFTEDQASLMSRYTDHVVIALDSDGPGRIATDRAIGIIAKSKLSTSVLKIPNGKDPDEFLSNGGSAAVAKFRELIDNSKDSFRYKFEEAKEDLDLDNVEDMVEYKNRCIDILSKIRDEGTLQIYIKYVNSFLKIDESVIMQSVINVRENKRKYSDKKKLEQISKPKYDKDDVNKDKYKYKKAAAAEERIITLLIVSPNLIKYCSNELSADDFVTDFNKKVYKAVYDVIKNKNQFDLISLSEDFNDAEMAKIQSLTISESLSNNAEGEMADCILNLKYQKAYINYLDSSITNEQKSFWFNRMKEIKKKIESRRKQNWQGEN